MRRKEIRPVPVDGSESETRSPKSRKPAPPPLLLPTITSPSRGVIANRGSIADAGMDTSAPADTTSAGDNERTELTEQTNAIVSQIVLINAHLIDANKFAPREIYNDNTLQTLAESLEKNGQRDPIHVIPNPDKPGRFIIGDGWTRVQSIRMRDILGLQVKAIIHDGVSEEDIAWLGYAQNEEREPHSDYDKACFYLKWRRQGWDWEAISQRTGVPVNTLYPYSSYSKLDPDILHYAKRYPRKVTVGAINQLARLITAGKSTDYVVGVCKAFVEDDLPLASLKERVDSVLEKSHKRTSKNSLLFQKRYKSANFKQRADGDIEVKARIPKEKLEAFNEEMDQILRRYCEETDPENSQSLNEGLPS